MMNHKPTPRIGITAMKMNDNLTSMRKEKIMANRIIMGALTASLTNI
ncbi:hypothetical protein F3D3_3549 [Fusibacter sp. 3D3]|nr:hypothetical protein F3D3_3549 [Fusibacter sp. 3D3]